MLTEVRQAGAETSKPPAPRYELEPDGAYRIDRYDAAPPFCSFLPGLGGPDGVPLWCLYVNRAQAVVSFGVQDKNHAIAEYLPATWAYQMAGLQGFRTFCKIDDGYYEPFRQTPAEHTGCTRSLRIRLDSLELTETNPELEWVTTVRYFAPVNRPLGALLRRVTFRNTAAVARRLSALDGLALILPAGLTDQGLKAMRHIHEAYASVRLACAHVPFYAMKVAAHDEAEVVDVTGGNFYAAWLSQGGDLQPVQPLVDPHLVFGAGHDLVTPRHFVAAEELDRNAEVWENRLPCALVPVNAVLEPGASLELAAASGFAPNEAVLAVFLDGFRTRGDLDRARAESRDLVENVVAPVRGASGVPALDAYVQQCYLDNVLRGGIPLLLPSAAGPTPLFLYSRRHGDLERDYNHFVLPAHPLSSGVGNYRDVLQNRRSDVWFYPEVAEHEIRLFVELLQADGYNPLSVEGYAWRLPTGVDPMPFCPADDSTARTRFLALIQNWFQPGEVRQWANAYAVTLPNRESWLHELLARCERRLLAHGHEGGYWVDHWTYVIDLLEAYRGIFPDRLESMLCGAADIGWFDEGAYVVPRSAKYTWRGGRPLQLHAVVDGQPASRELPPTTVFGKLCALVAVKAVSFDYAGRGIEMEAGRPGWNDSLNGLPGLFGSSVCEAAELARLAGWLRQHLADMPDTTLPVEVADLIEAVVRDLNTPTYSWDRAATLREQFRARLRAEVSGESRVVAAAQLAELLRGAERRALRAVEQAVDPQTGLLHTYYVNRPQVTGDGDASRGAGAPLAHFVPAPLPLFLEGQVHGLRLENGRRRARDIYQAVRRSGLYDAKLKMYKVNESLECCTPQIGRARTFTRGWFENESVWLHMSYKYLLELLLAGLHDEFFRDARTMLVPFMDPRVYGRSILENSSFLASSANPDPTTHGRGFIARLSGSTAEFLHLWRLLTAGADPFYLQGGELRFRLSPVLPGRWFTERPTSVRQAGGLTQIPEHSFACTLLGTLLLVYHNPLRRDTFGTEAVRPVRYVLDGRDEYPGPALDTAAALRIRDRLCGRIDVWLDSIK